MYIYIYIYSCRKKCWRGEGHQTQEEGEMKRQQCAKGERTVEVAVVLSRQIVFVSGIYSGVCSGVERKREEEERRRGGREQIYIYTPSRTVEELDQVKRSLLTDFFK